MGLVEFLCRVSALLCCSALLCAMACVWSVRYGVVRACGFEIALGCSLHEVAPPPAPSAFGRGLCGKGGGGGGGERLLFFSVGLIHGAAGNQPLCAAGRNA